MSLHPATSRIPLATGFFTVCLLFGLSACQRPVAQFQRSNRVIFHSPVVKPADRDVPDRAATDSSVDSGHYADRQTQAIPADRERTQTPVAYAEARPPVESTEQPTNGPVGSTYPTAERIRQHQNNARRLLTPAPDTDTPIPVSEHQPGPKPKKTLREILGLPPRKKLNWWQRISWQLKASVIVILVAVVFAILGITVLAIVFGIIGALLLIRGLKKSFKVRRGIFGLGG
ncbi:hypothetical protein [uncultured Fibrella sp.]|uniref:hypothetical protein n=1 Tax=uncultured Fibrella sp. TaxID=1284596 RepID=UPI0035CA3F8E